MPNDKRRRRRTRAQASWQASNGGAGGGLRPARARPRRARRFSLLPPAGSPRDLRRSRGWNFPAKKRSPMSRRWSISGRARRVLTRSKRRADYIRENLERSRLADHASKVSPTQTPRGTVQFVNLIAHWPNASPRAQKISRSARITTPRLLTAIQFVGANDGGSSTGALLEMARVLSLHPELAREDRAGFLRWRGSLRTFHRARTVFTAAAILRAG